MIDDLFATSSTTKISSIPAMSATSDDNNDIDGLTKWSRTVIAAAQQIVANKREDTTSQADRLAAALHQAHLHDNDNNDDKINDIGDDYMII